MDLKNLTFVDVETTGLSPIHDRVIEIGILKMKNNRIVKTYSTLINPEIPIPPEITLITGISTIDLEHAPTFSSVIDDIEEILHDSIFVAHNARFDYSFIRSEFARLNKSYSSEILCTAKLSRKLFPRFHRHNLDSIIERFNIQTDARHRAFADAKAIADFYKLIKKQIKKEALLDAIQFVTKTASLPKTIPPSLISKLPESPGVYIFYGKDGIPLYVGKSVNIKDRVRSHFYDYATSQKESNIFHSIESIETIPTSGELGALLMEAKLIKSMQPLYNRALRKADTRIALFRETNANGYFSISSKPLKEVTIDEIESITAIYKSKRQMVQGLEELSKKYLLCKKLLGVEKTHGACFGSQIRLCNGACVKKELPIKYNMRFTEAFSPLKIKQWPFPDAISITEKETSHIIYKWCYIGQSTSLISSDTMAAVFDYDMYKILSSFLLRKVRLTQIQVVPLSSYAQPF